MYDHQLSETVAGTTRATMRGMLSPVHLEFLANAGITEEVARKYCHSVTRLEHFPPKISRYFMLDETERTRPGLMFYWPVPGKEDVPQFRPDSAIVDSEGNEHKYIFSKECGSFVSVFREAEPTQPYLICEGTKQTLATLSWAPKGWGIAGVPGCQNWRGEALAWAQDHDIVIAFDKDTATNQAVHDAAKALKHDLEVTWGASGVAFAQLPAGRADDGLDDHLARIPPEGREGFLVRLIASVRKSLGRRPAAKKKELVVPPGAELYPAPDQPMEVARQLEPVWRLDGAKTLHYWQEDWVTWETTHWRRVSEPAFLSELYLRMENAQHIVTKANGDSAIHNWAPSRGKIADLSAAVRSISILDDRTQINSWIEPEKDLVREGAVISVTNGLLEIESRKLRKHTPTYFNRNSLPYAYEPEAGAPVEWLKFLRSVWPDDHESIDALQEWFGYVLSGHTDQHKIFSLIGQPRSGKGTIVQVLQMLVGRENYSGPSLSNLATNFGLEPLIDKMLVVVPDGRLPKEGRTTILERLLSISGGDDITVDRKNRTAWTGQMPCRMMVVSNDLVTFQDASGAISSRMLVVKTGESFLGREDTGILDRVAREMSGILLWALEGLDKLRAQGRFTQPKSADLARELIEEATSPGKVFVRDMCVTGKEYSYASDDLFDAWNRWCIEEEKRDHIGTRVTFAKMLYAAVPGLERVRVMKNKVRKHHYLGIALRPDGGEGGPETDLNDPFGGASWASRGTAAGPEKETNQDVSVRYSDETDMTDLPEVDDSPKKVSNPDVPMRNQEKTETEETTPTNLDVSVRYSDETDMTVTTDNWCDTCNQSTKWRNCRCPGAGSGPVAQ